MSTGDLSLDLLLSELLEASGDKVHAKELIKSRYPALTDKEVEELYSLIVSANGDQSKEAVSLAVTAPPSFLIKAKSTKNTVDAMIKKAQKSILITGYSLSDYFNDLVDVIIQKSQSGVFVEFFINNLESQKSIEKICRYKGRFLRVYNYLPSTDTMSALHAKVVSIDGEKTLITSANLSYHGQEGNVELGAYIESAKIAKQVKDVFTQLVFKKVFVEFK